jgi:siroheme synthase (precorrin-2 oxidase/ferrochelatase)
MNRRIASAIIILFVVATAHAQLSDRQIVKQAFPASLNDGDDLQFSRFITVDLNRNGQPLLVAVYTNGAAGAIRVLNRSGP